MFGRLPLKFISFWENKQITCWRNLWGHIEYAGPYLVIVNCKLLHFFGVNWLHWKNKMM